MNENIQTIIPHLRCPISGQDLSPLKPEAILALNRNIDNKTVVHLGNVPISTKAKSALITPDNQFVYLIDDGIFILLPGMAIVKKSLARQKKYEVYQQEASTVQSFYDQMGWKKEGKEYVDARQFEDSRPVMQQYIHKCHLRLNNYIKSNGKFILDIASGPVQYEEYLTYSRNFTYRVCADFSILALREARKKLGEKGIYILADITSLPLKSDSMDAVISIHTIYHVPAERQEQAFLELFRVAKPSASTVVIYTWHRPLLITASLLPIRILGSVRRLLSKPFVKQSKSPPPLLYFSPHTYSWFRQRHWPFSYRIACWRSIDINFSRLYIRDNRLGRFSLRMLYGWEKKCSGLAGKIGQYPIIIINK